MSHPLAGDGQLYLLNSFQANKSDLTALAMSAEVGD